MRYQLLLDEYKRRMRSSDPDYAETGRAIEFVVDAASHANEMVRKLDGYNQLLEWQERLGNAITLMAPSREVG